MFDLAPKTKIVTTTDGSGGHHQEQQKHDSCGKGRHDGVLGRVKAVFGDEEEKEKKGWVIFCLQQNLSL